MNIGLDVIAGSNQMTHIGVVKYVSRVEESPVKDKLGFDLKPFEIIFNVGDIITGARAAPLELCREVKVGDHVIIYSMESIYNSTFFYQPIRNLNNPLDSINLNYNNAGIEIKPTDKGKADIVINAGNNIVSIDSTDGLIHLESLNGIKLNGGKGTLDIRNDNHTLKDLLIELIREISALKVLSPQGPGTVAPESISKFIGLEHKVIDLLGDVENSEYYPFVPKNSLSPANVEDLVRELGLDILADEEVYISGTSAEIDEVREIFESEDNENPELDIREEPEVSPEVTNTSVAIDPSCPAGVIKNSTILSPNFDVAKLSLKTSYPHTLISISPSYTIKATGKRVTEHYSKELIACNLKALAINILEPLKARYSNMYVTSAFRSENSVKHGVSQHCKGEAADIQFRGVNPAGYMPIANWIIANLPYDQIIFEHSKKGSIWLHVSFSRNRSGRRSKLTMYKGKMEPGLKLYYS